MPHGDLSDFTAISLLVVGAQQIFLPAWSFSAIGPLQPVLDGTFENATKEQLALLKFMGAFMIIVAFMLFEVWWDGTNFHLPSLGFLLGAVNFGVTTYFTIDGGKFVPRVSYVYAALLIVGAIHLLFFRNKKNLADVIAEERAAKKIASKK